MKKLKLLPFLILFFSIVSISTVKASEVLRLCGFDIPPSIIPSAFCDPNGGIIYYGGNECDNQVIARVYFANLSGYDNPPNSGSYLLPLAMPDLYFRLDINFDGDYDDPEDIAIGPIDGFKHNGFELTGSDGGVHYIFEHKVDLTPYFPDMDLCPQGGDRMLHAQLSQPGGQGNDFEVFDVSNFASNFDVVSCEVFHEACSFCLDRQGNYLDPNCTIITPDYVVKLCADCYTSCEDDNFVYAPNTELFETKIPKVESKITPNPFNDVVEITFDIEKEAPVQIEVFDFSGKQLVQKSFSNDIGKRKETLNLESLPAGIYFLRLTAGESSTTSKIVKL